MGGSLNQIVVVGASLAGLRAVETLRRIGFLGRLTLVGDEPHLPYDRPPLSKEVMKGERHAGSTTFRDREHFEELDVDLRIGESATGLDLGSREVLLGDRRMKFDGLILATGAKPRTLPEARCLDGVHTLRTLDDALAISMAMNDGPRVAVVGAGFIGSEVAASARRRGLHVTILEALPVPLVRAVGEQMGAVCASLHTENGTHLHCGTGVHALEGTRRVEAVRLSVGAVLDADLVVVGVGVEPATGWLEGSGLTVRDGLVCDTTLCAGPPGVFAAGDMVRWFNPLFGGEMRVEHWTNAAEQGIAAARNLLAGNGARPFESVPYFWSDQYGIRMQLVGHPVADEVRVSHGSVEERRFVALYRHGTRLTAAFGMGWPKLTMQYRTKIAERISWDHALAFAASQV